MLDGLCKLRLLSNTDRLKGRRRRTKPRTPIFPHSPDLELFNCFVCNVVKLMCSRGSVTSDFLGLVITFATFSVILVHSLLTWPCTLCVYSHPLGAMSAIVDESPDTFSQFQVVHERNHLAAQIPWKTLGVHAFALGKQCSDPPAPMIWKFGPSLRASRAFRSCKTTSSVEMTF